METIDEMVACLLIALDGGDDTSTQPKCPRLVSAYKQFGVNPEHADIVKNCSEGGSW